MPYFLASDLGSSSCKTIVMNEQCRVLGTAQREYPNLFPKPGWVEQNPEDWYAAFCTTTKAALDAAGINGRKIEGVGITGVTHNAVLLDHRDQVLRPSILLYDTRSAKEANEIEQRWGQALHDRTVNRTSAMWTWPQLSWVARHEAGVFQSIRKVLFQKDYVRHRLAPSRATDWIDAHGSSLFDPRTGAWIHEFIADLGLPLDCLPQVLAPTEICGHVNASGSRDTGIPEGVPVITGTTDTAAEVLGSGAVNPGSGIVKLASVGRIAVVTTAPHRDRSIINYRHVLPGLWYPGTACKHAASAYRWLRDLLWPPDLLSDPSLFDRMNLEAETIPAGSEGLLFHPHLSGEWAPYFNDSLRGSFTGISVAHGRGHFTRALLEGVAMALRDALNHMEVTGLHADEIRLIGQGARGRLWRGVIASALHRRVLLPAERDAVFGAGLVTAMGLGFLSMRPEDVAARVGVEAVVEPDPRLVECYDRLFMRYRALDAVLANESRG
jgi:xylulokinase